MAFLALSRKAIVAVTNEWLGTPFIEGARLRNIGCDCAGLIEGVLVQFNIQTPPRNINLLQAAKTIGTEIPINKALFGDIIIFQSPNNSQDYHAGILDTGNLIIHAHWTQGVVKNTFGNWFKARAIAAFSLFKAC